MRTAEQTIHDLFVRATRKADRSTVDALLKALEPSHAFPAVFVRAAMQSAALHERATRWPLSLELLSRVTRQYSVGDKAFHATVAELLAHPWALEALRGATVADDAPLVALVALGLEGSESSWDALMMEFERARTARDDYGLRYKLRRLVRYAAPSANLLALDAAVKRELERRDGQRVEGSLAQQLGLNVELLSFHLQVTGTTPRHGDGVWLIICGDDKATGLPTQALGLLEKPPRDFMKVRAWLARVTKKESLTWDWANARVKSNLRGKHRDALVAWLRGLRTSPVPD